jgi:hypothetical protein
VALRPVRRFSYNTYRKARSVCGRGGLWDWGSAEGYYVESSRILFTEWYVEWVSRNSTHEMLNIFGPMPQGQAALTFGRWGRRHHPRVPHFPPG